MKLTHVHLKTVNENATIFAGSLACYWSGGLSGFGESLLSNRKRFACYSKKTADQFYKKMVMREGLGRVGQEVPRRGMGKVDLPFCYLIFYFCFICLFYRCSCFFFNPIP